MLLLIHDFSNVHQIYRDQDAFTWTEIIALMKEGEPIQKIAIESLEEADEYVKAGAEVKEFEGRFHGPNLEPTGFLLIELGDDSESFGYYFVVGVSNRGVLRIASTKVTTEDPKANRVPGSS